MSVESSIRHGNGSRYRIMSHSHSAKHYGTPHPFDSSPGVDFRWSDLWEQENPNPHMLVEYPNETEEDRENFSAWFAEQWRIQKICWAQNRFPQLRLWD